MKKILKTILATAFLLTSFSVASADTYTIDGKANNVHDFVGKVYVIVNFRLEGDNIKASVKVDTTTSKCFNGATGKNTYSVQKIARFLDTATNTTMVTLLGAQPWVTSINNEYAIDTNKEMSTSTCPVVTTTSTTTSTTTKTAMLLKTEQYSKFAVANLDKFPTKEACLASQCNALVPPFQGKYYAMCLESTNGSGWLCQYHPNAPTPGTTPATTPTTTPTTTTPTAPVTPTPVTTSDSNMCQRGNTMLLNLKGRTFDPGDKIDLEYFDKTLYIPYGHLMKPRVNISFDN